jgi:hypothetical protein
MSTTDVVVNPVERRHGSINGFTLQQEAVPDRDGEPVMGRPGTIEDADVISVAYKPETIAFSTNTGSRLNIWRNC